MNNPKLERCPFCGGDGRVHRQYHHPTRVISTRFEGEFTQALPLQRIGFAVECEKCLSVGGVAETKEEAAELWNRRTPLPDNKALTCEGCECEEGQSPSRCRRCMRYGDRTDNYRRPPEKGE